MNITQHPIIYPVILAVPLADRQLKPKERVAYLSRQARRALAISAEKSGVVVGDLVKDEHGAPVPFAGNFWSLTHKPLYVGAVVATRQIGIDIEKVRVCSPALFKKVATESEWNLVDQDEYELFFRYWTAKEATLKATTAGIRDLSKCRVTKILDADHLIVDYQDKAWHIEHLFFDGHVASVVTYDMEVEWTLL